MLVLSRKVGQNIQIGDDICVTVLSVNGNSMRIGITAPDEVTVHREEVLRRIEDERLAARDGVTTANSRVA